MRRPFLNKKTEYFSHSALRSWLVLLLLLPYLCLGTVGQTLHSHQHQQFNPAFSHISALGQTEDIIQNADLTNSVVAASENTDAGSECLLCLWAGQSVRLTVSSWATYNLLEDSLYFQTFLSHLQSQRLALDRTRGPPSFSFFV